VLLVYPTVLPPTIRSAHAQLDWSMMMRQSCGVRTQTSVKQACRDTVTVPPVSTYCPVASTHSALIAEDGQTVERLPWPRPEIREEWRERGTRLHSVAFATSRSEHGRIRINGHVPLTISAIPRDD